MDQAERRAGECHGAKLENQERFIGTDGIKPENKELENPVKIDPLRMIERERKGVGVQKVPVRDDLFSGGKVPENVGVGDREIDEERGKAHAEENWKVFSDC